MVSGGLRVPSDTVSAMLGATAGQLTRSDVGIISTATAAPPVRLTQEEARQQVTELLYGQGWQDRPALTEQIRRLERLYSSSKVEHRQFVVNPAEYYKTYPGTGQRMADYRRYGYDLARTALEACLGAAADNAGEVTDFVLVSCTGYSAPGLDVLLARDLGMPSHVRRTVIGHMGCAGGIIGLRDALASVRGREGSRVALLAIELCSLHYQPTRDLGTLTCFALFGDAAAAVLLGARPAASTPVIVDTYCASDFAAMDQMTWSISDAGFEMRLSIRVPVTLRRNITPALERLLAPHGLETRDISHWLIHPGGPSIVEAIQDVLGLEDDQVALSWDVLREVGNCSSTTVLLMLDRLLHSGRTHSGQWGVMMAFGPGLTLETCLLRF